MGRHGGGPSSRTRTSWPVVAIGLLVVAAIGFGLWLWSIRSVADPIDADPVDAYAVVVSSPSCTAGSGSTVIDLSISPPVRSSISACGRRVGERIAVQYLAGHPDQARLAGTAVAHNNSARSWLPIAILGAGVVAVSGILFLLIDRRRSRHDSRTTGTGDRRTVAQLRAAAGDGTATAAASDPATGAYAQAVQSPPDVGTVGAADSDGTPGTLGGSGAPDDASPDVTSPDVTGPDTTSPDTTSADTTSPDVTGRIAAGALPGIGSTPLRPSDIVDDDLFTHRTRYPG